MFALGAIMMFDDSAGIGTGPGSEPKGKGKLPSLLYTSVDKC